jgi:hypothetical protein
MPTPLLLLLLLAAEYGLYLSHMTDIRGQLRRQAWRVARADKDKNQDITSRDLTRGQCKYNIHYSRIAEATSFSGAAL